MSENVYQARNALMRDPLVRIMPRSQRSVLADALRGQEREAIATLVLQALKSYADTPETYKAATGRAAVAHLHYFKGCGDWFVLERDILWPEKGDYDQAYGFCAPFGKEEGDLGYMSLIELAENGVELDLHWTPKLLEEAKK